MTFLNYFDQITLDPDQDNEVAAWFGLDKNASYGYTPPIAPELLEPLYHYAVKYCIDLSNHFDQHKISLS